MRKFVIVNEDKRINFEKENYMSFGYSNDGCQLYSDYDRALSDYHFLLFNSDGNYTLEMHENGEVAVL